MGKYPKTLGRIEAVWNKLGGEEGVDKFLAGELVVGKPGSVVAQKRTASPKILANLLEEEGKPIRLAAEKRFVARDKLVVDVNGELPISYLGDNLKTNFLDLVEENVPAMAVRQRKLLQRSLDKPILAALGDYDLDKIEKAKVALTHVFDFLKTADRSKWFIFYVADAKGVVWAVCAFWSGDGWVVEAYSVRFPNVWIGGVRVVSR